MPGEWKDNEKGTQEHEVEEEILLPPLDKKWPFLLRFPISWFGMSIGLASQAYLWKSLAIEAPINTIRVPHQVNLVVWCMAVFSWLVICCTYLMKCVKYWGAVKRESAHPVRGNFFFAPWVAWLFLALGAPECICGKGVSPWWMVMMVPIFGLELKVYGEWLLGGERRLSEVANPSTHLSLVGNFIGALLVAKAGWKEAAMFLWAIGIIHYVVLFVTLYQRLPITESVPKELHPVFFLFVAAPCTASVAWKNATGDFDYLSRICFFVGLFLYSTLVVRINFFRGFPFSISWWAFLYPMTSAAIATIHYSEKVNHPFSKGLVVVLSAVSTITVLGLFLSTLIHGVFLGTLFPNDISITYIENHKQKQDNQSILATNKDPILPVHCSPF